LEKSTDKSREEIKIRVLKNELVDWEIIEPLQNNDLKEFTEDEMNELKNSILERGFLDPVKIWQDENGKLWYLDGRHRKYAMQQLKNDGHKIPIMLPAIFLDCVDRKEAAEFVLVYTSQYARTTRQGLIKYINNFGLDITHLQKSINIPNIKFHNLILKPPQMNHSGPGMEENNESELDDPISEFGEIWKLGRHFLICGDAKDKGNVSKLKELLGSDKYFLFTDPPYEFAVEELEEIFESTEINHLLLMCTFRQAAYFVENTSFTFSFDLVLNQKLPSSSMNKAVPYFLHKNIIYLRKNDAKTRFNCDNATGVFSENGYYPSIIEAAKNTKESHGLAKNIDGIIKILSGFKANTIIDPFGGGGSTLMACERTNRICGTIELFPENCDKIIRKYEQETGQKAEKYT
jgi:DNA modification methylase